MKTPKMWYRKQTKCWYVQLGSQQYNLGKNQKEAEEKYRRILADGGLDPGHEAKITVHELVDKFERHFKATHPESTYRSRVAVLESFRNHFPTVTCAQHVRPYHVQEWIDKKKDLKPSTINTRITFVISIFNWGKRFGYLEHNPIQGMPKPTPIPRQDFIQSSRWRELVRSAGTRPAKDLIRFALDTGIRAEEVSKLTAERYDPEKQRFIIEIEDSKGRKRSRVVYLTELSNRIADKLCRRYPTGPIFRTSRGTPWTKDSLNSLMRRIKKRMQLDTLCFTMLRHSFAHYRLSKGQDAATVAKLMGHTSTQMIYSRYGHLESGDLMNKAANAVHLPL